MLKLHHGFWKPQNDWERSVLRQMKEMEESGIEVDFSENLA